jgi:hypothetical protein
MRNTALTFLIASASFALTFAFAPAMVFAESSVSETEQVEQKIQAAEDHDPDCRNIFTVISSGLRGKVCA